MNYFLCYLTGGAIYLAIFSLSLGIILYVNNRGYDWLNDKVFLAAVTSFVWPFATIFFIGKGLGFFIKQYLENKERKEKALELVKKEQERVYKIIDDEIADMLKKEWIV